MLFTYLIDSTYILYSFLILIDLCWIKYLLEKSSLVDKRLAHPNLPSSRKKEFQEIDKKRDKEEFSIAVALFFIFRVGCSTIRVFYFEQENNH